MGGLTDWGGSCRKTILRASDSVAPAPLAPHSGPRSLWAEEGPFRSSAEYSTWSMVRMIGCSAQSSPARQQDGHPPPALRSGGRDPLAGRKPDSAFLADPALPSAPGHGCLSRRPCAVRRPSDSRRCRSGPTGAGAGTGPRPTGGGGQCPPARRRNAPPPAGLPSDDLLMREFSEDGRARRRQDPLTPKQGDWSSGRLRARDRGAVQAGTLNRG